jgi:phenylacetaldehyde dehydrogenase
MTHQCGIRELVAGQLQDPEERLLRDLTDSDTGEVLHPQVATAKDAVDAAVATAWDLHVTGAWTSLPAAERAAALRAFQSELSSRIGELAAADSLDTGVPVHWTTALVTGRVGMLESAAVQLEQGFERTEHAMGIGAADQWRLPWGPAAVFLPWNAPAPTVITKIGDALVAGCPVVVKPSEWAPHSSGPLAEAVAASLPPGLVQVVHGDRAVGEALVSDDRIAAVTYTGGVEGGRAVAEACARQLKPVDLELSGNNPVVALPDADPDAVVSEVVFGMQFLNGQICVGPRRLVVHRDQLDTYLDKLGDALSAAVIGPSTQATTTLGPIAHAEHLAHLTQQLSAFAERGCDVRSYGTVPDGAGLYLRPTVVLADRAAELRTEVFGPVLLVRTYTDVDEAVRVANDHPYGLAAFVFGADRDEARAVGSRLRAGLVTVNAVLNSQADAPAIGSMWGSSGLGTVGAGQGAAFFAGHRVVG